MSKANLLVTTKINQNLSASHQKENDQTVAREKIAMRKKKITQVKT